MLVGGAAVFCIGLADDIQPLPPLARLAVQMLAATVGAVGAGVRGILLFLGAVLWLLAMTNAHNFIDGLDGLFAGSAALEGVGIAMVLSLSGREDRALLPLLLSVACLGFLRYNRHPARVFAGDCGSGAVGFLLGAAALPALTEPAWELGTLAPLFVFAYPLTDLTAAVLRRAARGKSPFSADRGHLHHRICAMGIPQSACAAILWGLTATAGVCGVLLTRAGDAIPAAISALAAVAVLILTRRTLVWEAEKHAAGGNTP